jgi:hypothetical protein
MSILSATVEVDIKANQSAAFEHIVPIDLASIFRGYGPLPSIISTQNQTGTWNAAGQTRTVLLSDGSSARELLTKYEYPHYFSYTVSGFTGVLRYLTTSANGEWWFNSDASSGKTHVKWRYAFNARSIFAVPVLWFIVKMLWHGYMNKALALSKSQVEGKAT